MSEAKFEINRKYGVSFSIHVPALDRKNLFLSLSQLHVFLKFEVDFIISNRKRPASSVLCLSSEVFRFSAFPILRHFRFSLINTLNGKFVTTRRRLLEFKASLNNNRSKFHKGREKPSTVFFKKRLKLQDKTDRPIWSCIQTLLQSGLTGKITEDVSFRSSAKRMSWCSLNKCLARAEVSKSRKGIILCACGTRINLAHRSLKKTYPHNLKCYDYVIVSFETNLWKHFISKQLHEVSAMC